MKKVKIYTDGACRGNPGIGGWGALLRYGRHEKILSGAENMTTNNRMELTAAIMALAGMSEPCEIDLYTDSQYLQKGITEWLPVWKKRHYKKSGGGLIKNVDLWKILEIEVSRHKVKWHWVRGHSGHAENEQADLIANEAIDKLLEG